MGGPTKIPYLDKTAKAVVCIAIVIFLGMMLGSQFISRPSPRPIAHQELEPAWKRGAVVGEPCPTGTPQWQCAPLVPPPK
jgi:hypothetical protein